ncbi:MULTISPECIES: hypothetical protein [Halomonadaceae]|uniref:Uncharacterized protein n=1 Tax=Halomonas johnsoniae TaxID=502832 RepID=A0ABQ2WDQ0_9GAMM|nr:MULTISPECIES: hypothetical protein [Halomonas]GGW46475.1 hypothetical protein GCM10007158_04230 [Halomonas johnsoniae]
MTLSTDLTNEDTEVVNFWCQYAQWQQAANEAVSAYVDQRQSDQ